MTKLDKSQHTIPAWIIPHKKIVLEEKIKSGRFADIFKARYDTKQNGRVR
jgi:hypothetical protein